MQQITQISDDPKQKSTVVLDNGNSISISIAFSPQQLGWFITELTYLDTTLRGIRIVSSPNILRQWKNLIPFGLACFVTDNQEPTQQEDFLSERANLYILSAEEVQDFEAVLSG